MRVTIHISMQPYAPQRFEGLGLSDLDASPRTRLLEAMLLAVVEKGYAEATIADVVRLARMSKRTFYEHFPDKETCFLSAYAQAAAALIGRIALAVRETGGQHGQIAVAARTYFQNLEEHPALTRMLLSDIHAAGPAALVSRRRVHQQFADLICAIANMDPARVVPFSRELATAVVGGINELILLAIDEGRVNRLHELNDTAMTLIDAVLSTQPRKSL